jgi:phosphatidylserine/phosphatidylglycerophosphate/cardiolipin synthase-like enzyme
MDLRIIWHLEQSPVLKGLARSLKILVLLLTTVIFATAADVDVYFSPNGGATDAVVREIGSAHHEILIQAYSFTSTPIASSLIAAKNRGIKVEAILDKTNVKQGYSVIIFLENAGIPVYIDDQVKIAHSKIIIIDDTEVITGSFNFTKSAEYHNTENLLILKNDPCLIDRYLANFTKRFDLSHRLLTAGDKH